MSQDSPQIPHTEPDSARRSKLPAFSGDQPLQDPADDKLDRKRFSAEIARSIHNWSGRDSLVVSLTGEWGAGKSTIKNFIIYYLRGKAHILEFNPWQWSGQDKLLEAFLWQLGELFGKHDIAKKAKKLATQWKAYASILKVGGMLSTPSQTLIVGLFSAAVIGLVVSAFLRAPLTVVGLFAALLLLSGFSFLSTVTNRIARALTDWAAFRERPLEELRSDIENELRKLDRPVVVFIDDIDRLTDSEIKLLVQLVKANAQFPNVVFFLLFQKNIVTKALSTITSDDGAKYLSKIVQVEFAVPAASQKELQGILTKGFDQILTRDGVKIRWEERRWPLLFLDTLWPYFGNLRDIKRFLGVFEFYFDMHLNKGTLEVNPIDLIAVEVLRMFDHDAFLAVSKSFFRRSAALRSGLFAEEKIGERFQADIDLIVAASDANVERKERLKALLQSLFPQATGDRSENDWKRDLRICDEMSFDKYFQVCGDPTKPTAYEVSRFIEVARNREELVALLRQTIANNTIEDFLDFLFVTKDEIPVAQMQTVATALFDVGDELPDPKPSMFSVGLDMQCNRIMYHRLKNEDRATTTALLWNAFVETTGFILPIQKLTLEDRSVRERGEKTDFVISEERLQNFVDLVLDRIRVKANDFSLLEHKDCAYVLYRWKDWSKSEEVNQWMRRVLMEPSRTLQLLRHLVWISTMNGVKKVPFVNGESIEKLVPLEELQRAVSMVPLGRQTEEDRANSSLLAKALMLKSQGKPYSNVRASYDDF
jgi:predicted KAP-like P-loop ATPase